MNYLVFLNAQAGELEKILSGTKSMLIKELCPASEADLMVVAGDTLYFLRNTGDCSPHVKATVLRVSPFIKQADVDLSNILKEMQSRLQLTEDQYNEWSVKGQFVLVEIHGVHKVEVSCIRLDEDTDRTGWIPFEMPGQLLTTIPS